MLDTLIGGGYGYGRNGYGHEDHRSSGYGFQDHSEFLSHEDSERGYFDRQARYDHQMRLPANHGRPQMAHMPFGDEDDSDLEEDFHKSSQSHHTTVLPHHGNNHHQQTPHMNFMPLPTMGQSHQNGRDEDGYHAKHGMQHHGGHGMDDHGGHGMQQYGGHGMQQHGAHQHHGAHGMQQHGAHGTQQHGAHGMKYQDRLMGPQVQPHHVYMNPSHGSGSGRAVMVKASEKWRMSNSTGGHHKAGWGSKGL